MKGLAVVLVLAAACSGGAGTGKSGSATAASRQQPAKPAELEPALPVAELTGKLIARIEIVGVERGDPKALRKLLELRQGTALAVEDVAADARRLWDSGQLSDVRVEARRVDGGIEVRFVVRERPLVDGLEVHGTITRDQLAPAVVLRSGMVMSWDKLEQTRANILALYDQMGVTGTIIETVIADRPGNEKHITLKVEPGVQHVLGSLRFEGNKALSDAELAKLAAAKSGEVVHQQSIERWEQVLTAAYYDRGYINVRIDGTHDSKSKVVTLAIDEGDQFRVGTIEISGALAAPAKKYRAVIKSRKGEIFKRSKVGADIQAVQKLHQSLTHPKAGVTPLTDVDTASKTVGLDFRLSK